MRVYKTRRQIKQNKIKIQTNKQILQVLLSCFALFLQQDFRTVKVERILNAFINLR